MALATSVNAQGPTRTSNAPSTTVLSPTAPPLKPPLSPESDPLSPSRKEHAASRHRRHPSLKRAKDSTEVLRDRARSASRDPSQVPPPLPSADTTIPKTPTISSFEISRLSVKSAPAAVQEPLPPPPSLPTPPPEALSRGVDRHNSPKTAPTPSSWKGTPTPGPSPPLEHAQRASHTKNTTNDLRTAGPRAQSFSLTSERSQAPGSDLNEFQVVVDRPSASTGRRPSSAGTTSLTSYPRLDVHIPHYRLGIPRFSLRGGVTLRGSVYTPDSGADDAFSSRFAWFDPDHLFPAPASNSQYSMGTRSWSFSSPGQVPSPLAVDRDSQVPQTPRHKPRKSRSPITPALYDDIARAPARPSEIRLGKSDRIIAATPARIVAYITSPSFLDYELLSDFFLTFRAYLLPDDLLEYLAARLQWALQRNDDFGRIVRVRTFVAIRHWILNYFLDDFLPNLHLRVRFCKIVNTLSHQAQRDSAVDGKINGELKKCWRRTCALYWDPPESSTNADQEDITPGGQIDSQELEQDPRRWRRASTRGFIRSRPDVNPTTNGALFSPPVALNTVTSPASQDKPSSTRHPLISYQSEQSVLATSCSLPVKQLRNQLTLNPPRTLLGIGQNIQSAPLPQERTLASSHGQQSRRTHKRGGSFSDALRDERSPLSPPGAPEFGMTPIFTGSLIRGLTVQPASPFFNDNSVTISSPLGFRPSFMQDENGDMPRGDEKLPLRTPPAVRKLFGGMRRALSTRQPLNSPPAPPSMVAQAANARPIQASAPPTSGGRAQLAPGLHSEPLERPVRRPTGQAMRLDVLSAHALKTFNQAINGSLEQLQRAASDDGRTASKPKGETNGANSREDHDAHDEHSDRGGQNDNNERNYQSDHNEHSDHNDQFLSVKNSRSQATSHVTTGSRSIVIVNDTAPPIPIGLEGYPSSLGWHNMVMPSADEPSQHADHNSNLSRNRDSSLHLNHSPPPESMDTSHVSRDQRDFAGLEIQQVQPIHDEYDLRSPPPPSPDARFSATQVLRRASSLHDGLLSPHRRSSLSGGIPHDEQLADDCSDSPGPVRQLRRRPGGNLREVNNVHDLQLQVRPHSAGSLTDYSKSRTVSFGQPSFGINTYGISSHGFTLRHPVKFGSNNHQPPVEKVRKAGGSVGSARNLRPSFELEVAKLAQIPDDTDDDGGINSALLKLEGKYVGSSAENSPRAEDMETMPQRLSASDPTVYLQGLHGYSGNIARAPSLSHQADGLTGTTPADSKDSFDGGPLLGHGNSFHGHPVDSYGETSVNGPDRGPPRPANPSPDHANARGPALQTDAAPAVSPRESEPPSATFLLDENESLSDLSMDETSSPLKSPVVKPTPLISPAPTLHATDTATELERLRRAHIIGPNDPLTGRELPQDDSSESEKASRREKLDTAARNNMKMNRASVVSNISSHFPFVLNYPSKLLAEQFTIIERDALDEIDWRELIELRWSQAPSPVRNWVEYLQQHDHRGIDLVISRFNIMVKWVVSECVLTDDLEERAHCLIKYIHIAAHARRLRNYATMYQITLALVSTDCSRLKKTWARVPPAEIATLKRLETLIHPVRNFHSLRMEMETADLDHGCIPFIGIYTHDLTYNAEKPEYIDDKKEMTTGPAEESQLVNFERYHTAAVIVKNLLRLLEASSRYTLTPHAEPLSRCLWMSALSDAEITMRSRRLESEGDMDAERPMAVAVGA